MFNQVSLFQNGLTYWDLTPHPHQSHPPNTNHSQCLPLCTNTHRYRRFQRKEVKLLMLSLLMHLLNFTSQTRTDRIVRPDRSERVYVSFWVCLPKSCPQPLLFYHPRKHGLSLTSITNATCCPSPFSPSLLPSLCSLSLRHKTDKHTNCFWCETVDQRSF